LSVGAKHLQDKLSVIAKNSSPNASPVQLSVVMAKHLEDKLSVITKNSSPNASPVQLSVVMGKKNIPCSLFQTISKIVVSGTCHLKKRVIGYICV
jgi:hypothetical protein